MQQIKVGIVDDNFIFRRGILFQRTNQYRCGTASYSAIQLLNDFITQTHILITFSVPLIGSQQFTFRNKISPLFNVFLCSTIQLTKSLMEKQSQLFESFDKGIPK